MRKFFLGVICILLVSAVRFATENKQKTPMVECGKFVKIYNPSVGENEKWYINDHCFIYGPNNMWHLFGITHEEPCNPLDEDNFAHATAKALLQQPWLKRKFTLTVISEPPWNETHLWAPHVILHDNSYYMFYCAGSIDHSRYKIHLATSKDMNKWKRHAKNPMVVDGFDARDPFIMRLGKKWMMYYTATSAPKGGNHVVAYVTSQDLITWKNRGSAFKDPSKGTCGGNTESPFVVQRGENYFLFIGPRGDYDGTDVFVSSSPYHWRGENKVGHIRAHAAEVVRDIDGKWYVSRCGWARGGVYLAPLVWKDQQQNPVTNISAPKKNNSVKYIDPADADKPGG
jgi:arabinan endo-1,5-alpha-L-arabinosidase